MAFLLSTHTASRVPFVEWPLLLDILVILIGWCPWLVTPDARSTYGGDVGMFVRVQAFLALRRSAQYFFIRKLTALRAAADIRERWLA